ncbi:Vmn1r139 [Phodopus roborovskii]|uniref:Vomeronasal type-1 receptor n=1 Tax=Phodopus roborovskii TaxID=109678 RepID=A0AAV0AAE2_PHORO|nr:Vmn1r139 [Phodopus roborovskii]
MTLNVSEESQRGTGIFLMQFAHDATFISIMAWTSVSMLHLLYNHYRRMHHILTPIQDHRVHFETRAAHTILMLVVTFVSFYILNFICIIFHSFLMDSRLWLRHVNELLAISFPTISPFLLLLRDPKDPCSVLFHH